MRERRNKLNASSLRIDFRPFIRLLLNAERSLVVSPAQPQPHAKPCLLCFNFLRVVDLGVINGSQHARKVKAAPKRESSLEDKILDPLTALGLASNIVQTVQFTSDLISKSREYHVDGSLVKQLELEAITVNLRTLSQDLVVPGSGGVRAAKTERQLRELCIGCQEVSDELLVTVQSLKVRGFHNTWTSFRQALKSVWKEEKIKTLEERLERYRRQIDTTLLISIREGIDRSINSLSKSERDCKQIAFAPDSGNGVKQWQSELLNKVHQSDWNLHAERRMIQFSTRLSASAMKDRDDLIKQQILARLHFDSINDRAERIPKAHQNTFDWIFHAPESSHDLASHVSGNLTSDMGTTQPSSARSAVYPLWAGW
ncbi:uncharacterized protein LY89DRAFT_774731 [Mollisia scopiformis]|uniref:Fungal N-terminal domain-containing protein n=1 Tax=Mollisia scopiformis TaxID=149040 RepID=A0A194XEX1_MOLSC|nr:uncharacterized protein LY89DRAFT_774731 [Mollisia scopiformis]KUJ18696.1 hypothetical protein LY89DRAFT_774731 [Mollisia scopiformis]